VALAIAVAVAITANGIANLERGVPFWYGMGKTAVVGAVSGAISMGIGGAVSSLNGIAKIAAEAALHGISGGLISLASGGEFESGFFSGMVSSIISSSLTELGTTKNELGKLVPKNEFGRTYLKAAMIAAGGLSGTISARIAGGNFWDGMRQGLITAGLNHVEHMVFDPGSGGGGKMQIKNKPKEKAELKNFIEFANDYNSLVLNTAGLLYGTVDLAINHNHQGCIKISNKLSSFFGGSAGIHNRALKQLSGNIAKVGTFTGGLALSATVVNLGYQTYYNNSTPALWIDAVISTTLFVGSVVPNPFQPLFIGGSILYGGARLGFGNQIDNKII